MRARITASVVFASAVTLACAHEDVRPSTARAPESRAASAAPPGPPQYLVADPLPRGAVLTVALGAAGTYGLLVGKTRVVVGRGEPRVASQTTDVPFVGATKIPGRFGGGFLFWSERALYRSDAFDGPLRPLARVPDVIATISFAPKYLLVRTTNGERWGLGVPSGERATIQPLNVADIEALDDGRALAFNDQGAAFASTDGGGHWSDITAQIRSSPTRVAVIDDQIFLLESSGSALRLESDGQLSYFDKEPPEKPPEIRPRDPKWRGQDAPLRAAFHSGAAIDEATAVVIEAGDVFRIDLHTGEVVSVVAGKLPPEAQCEAVPGAPMGDVLFACVSRGAAAATGASAFVVSHTLSPEPIIEQSFGGGGGQFYTSDDGGLAYGGPCALTPSSSDETVCVRQPGGTWEEHDVAALSADGGAGDVQVARWVPRADGRVAALVTGATTGIFDPRTGVIVPVPEDARELFASHAAPIYGHNNAYFRKYGHYRPDASPVDHAWSFAPNGSLRGWQRHGGIAEISVDGRVTRSPYAFEVLAAGPYALGRTTDGRLYQTTDHGATWTEVAAPPSGGGAVEMKSCTTAGCDLGAFYRVGWSARSPRVDPPPSPAPSPAEVRRARALELSCRPAGTPATKILPRTETSPDDLGLGAQRVPVANERSSYAYLRTPLARAVVHPLRDVPVPGDGDASGARAMLMGYQTARDGEVIEVLGPNRNAAALRRPIAYVAPFDPGGKLGRAVIAMSDVISVARGIGMTLDEILSEDMTEVGNIVLVTPVDPTAPADLVFHNSARGLLALIRNERVRVAMRSPQNEATVVSGVVLGDEAAFLEVEAGGVGHVFKMTAGGISDLFDLSPTIDDAAFYPANPDALAVGPKNELGVLRTASGSDPASAWDPAIVMVPAMPPVALAPWSELRFADDPACKEPGWRATLQLIAPWVRVSTPELRVDEAPIFARVKWNEKRVCLEAVEAKLPNVSVRAPGPAGSESTAVATWLVGKGSTFARVGVGEGVEWRQPLECTVVAPAPPVTTPRAP